MAEEEETREVLFSDWSGPEKQGMTLEQSGEGEIYVKEVKMESPAGRTGRVHEGDQIVGATIYFDNMSSKETTELLKTLNKHKVGLKLQNKDKSPCRSPMGTLSPCRSPMGTLTYEGRGRVGGSSQDIILSGDDEDYKRIYSKKIKPRLKSEDLAEGVDVRTERHSSTSTDGSTTTTITRRITTYTVDMPEGVDEQLDLTSPEFKGQRYEQSGGGSSSQMRVLHGSGSPSGIRGGLEGGDFELGGDGVSFTGPDVTSSSEKHWSTGGVKTTTVTRQIEGGDSGAAGIRFKGSSFGMPGAKSQREFGLYRGGEQGDGSFQVSGDSADYQAGSINVTVPGKTTNISSSSISMGKGEVRGVDVHLPGRGSADWKGRAGGSVPGITISDQQMTGPGSTGLSRGNQGGVSLPNMPGIDTGLNGGKISTDIRAPTLDINTSGMKESGSVKMSVKETTTESKLKGGIKMPSFGLNTGGADSDGDVKLPKVKGSVDISVPGVDVDLSGASMNMKGGKTIGGVSIKAPKVDIKGSGVDIEGPEGGFKIPKEKISSFGVRGAELEGTGVDVNLPKTDIDIKGPKVDIEGPDVDIEGSGGFKMPKMKMPSFGIKGSKVEGDVDVKLPKGDIDIKGPNVNIKGPELDIKGPDGKIKGPKFKMPSMSGPNISMPDMDINLKGPKVKGDLGMSGDLKAPKVDIEGPDVDMEGSGGFKMPKMKMPSFGIKGSKLEGPDIDVNLPKADIDIKAPNVDIKGPSISGPNISMPDVDFNLKGPKVKGPKISMPDVDFNLKGPKLKGDVDVSVPKLEGDIKSPKVDIKGPSISGPNISMPDVDFNLKGPKVKGDLGMSGDLKAPKVGIEGPDVDIEGSGGFKMPKMKIPSFGIKGPKLEGADVDLNLPKADIDIKGPSFDISRPDLNIKGPDAKLSSGSLDMGSPSFSIDKPDVKFPKFKGPTFGIRSPEVEGPELNISHGKMDVKAPVVDLNLGDANIKGPKFKAPKIHMGGKSPKLDVNLPEGDSSLEAPDVDIHVKGKKGKFKLPKIKGKAKKADVDIDLETSGVDLDVDSPELHLKGAKVKKPFFGKLHFPDVEFDVKSPKVKGDGSLSGGLSSGSLQANIEAPDLNVQVPDVKTKSNIKFPGMKIRGPQVNVPDVDVNVNRKNLKGEASLSGDLKGPKIDIGGGGGGVDVDSNVSGYSGLHFPEGHVSFPKINVPKYHGPEMGEDVDAGARAGAGAAVRGGKIDVQAPSVSGSSPSLELHSGEKVKVKMPRFGFGKSKAKGGSAADLSFQGPDAELRAGGSGGVKGSKELSLSHGELVSGKLSVEGGSGHSVSPKSKSASLDLFKKSRHRSSSVASDEGDLAVSSPSSHLSAEGGDISVDVGGAKVKGKKLKFGTFGGFGSKSKGSYEVRLGEGSEERVEVSGGVSLPSKKSRISSSSSSDSGSRGGFRFPKLELSVSPKK